MRIDEYKNISNEVVDISKKIYKMIVQQSKLGKKYESKYVNTVFNEGTVEVYDMMITIDYLMYYTSSIEHYNYVMNFVGDKANSYTDYDKRYIKIVSGFIGNEPSPDLLANISHEVSHIFEYDNGREKRVDLYDNTIKMIQSGNTYKQIVAKCIYYTFQHEIDAFVHQFYGFLCQTKPVDEKPEDLLQYSEFKNAIECFDYVKTNINNVEIQKAINELGYNKRNFLKRIRFGIKKLERKLYNAYTRYENEVKPKPQNESIIRYCIRKDSLLQEDIEYFGENIEWGVESIFQF